METEKYYFRVGMFFLSVMGIFVWYLMIFGADGERENLARYAVYFDSSVAGMTKGAPVRLKGLDVGLVTDIRFASHEDGRILAIVDLDDAAPVREDTVATIAFQGITGTTYMAMENTRSEESLPPLSKKEGEEYPVIRSQPSDLQVILAEAPAVMSKMSEVSEQMQKLFSDKNITAAQNVAGQAHDTLLETTGAVREIKMLARTIREDPSIILRGSDYDGYKVNK